MLDMIAKARAKNPDGRHFGGRLLLHSCCAPCSGYVLELLAEAFELTVYYSNGNIYPFEEYSRREREQRRLADIKGISYVEAEYDGGAYEQLFRGLEGEREGGARCLLCIERRMRTAADYARQNGFDFFTTTLSVSPHKNSAAINRIGGELEREIGVRYLYADFKKQDGYKKSVQLSQELGLYRQDYCGCKHSMDKL